MAQSNVFQLQRQAPPPVGGALRFYSWAFIRSDRFIDMDRRQSYYDCTQHDAKRYDFDGRILNFMPGLTNPSPGEKAGWYVPLKQRRPSAPYRLARVIVDAFTNMLFGEGRFPSIVVNGDAVTQDFLQAVARAGGLPGKMMRARACGGATGTACMSWSFIEGRPRFEVHESKNCFVHEWDDRDQLIPRTVTECYLYPKDVWNDVARRMDRKHFWYRRDWTPDEDIVFHPVEFKFGQEPVWQPDANASVRHGDGVCHFVWMQNLPAPGIDGVPDYDGLLENFDSLDTLLSVVVRGAILNLDPTLKLKMDPDMLQAVGLRKGSDNALVVGTDGDADYLELAGQSITAGIALFNAMRGYVLEVAQCVIPDPNEVAARGTSSLAMKMMYAPMLGKSDAHREQYGSGMARLLEPMYVVARRHVRSFIDVKDEATGEVQRVEATLVLPPRIERTPVLDDDGKPTGEVQVTRVPREPGEGGEIDLQWGQRFQPTPDDQAKMATTLSTATGGKAFLSKQTATEVAAYTFGRDPSEEWKRVQDSHAEDQAQQADMFADANGTMGGKEDEAGDDGRADITLAPTDLAAIVTVNEARASAGLGPLADPVEGKMTITEFKAKYSKPIAQAAAADQGKEAPVDPAKAAPKPFGGGGAPPFGGPPKQPPPAAEDDEEQDE